MTPVGGIGGPVGVSERGPLGLGREGEGLVLRHSRSRMCTLRRSGPRRRSLVVARSLRDEKKKEVLEPLARTGRTRFRCTNEAVLDAGGRSGPRWSGDAWGCVGRRWALGTSLDRRRLATGDAWLARLAALLDGSA